MSLSKLVPAILTVWMIPAFAALPQPTVPPAKGPRIDLAAQVLQNKYGIKLNARQLSDLENLSSSENQIASAGEEAPEFARTSTKSIYCVGIGFNAFMGRFAAGCVHVRSLKSYSVSMIGAGVGFRLVESVFRLTVSYDGSRYAQDFDPIPGQYGMVTMGASLGMGLTGYAGDSGNKTLIGSGYAAGFGLDFGTVSLAIIE